MKKKVIFYKKKVKISNIKKFTTGALTEDEALESS